MIWGTSVTINIYNWLINESWYNNTYFLHESMLNITEVRLSYNVHRSMFSFLFLFGYCLFYFIVFLPFSWLLRIVVYKFQPKVDTFLPLNLFEITYAVYLSRMYSSSLLVNYYLICMVWCPSILARARYPLDDYSGAWTRVTLTNTSAAFHDINGTGILSLGHYSRDGFKLLCVDQRKRK